jgi:hypothetical protein
MRGPERLYHAKYSEWLASLIGACLIAAGVGVLLAHWLQASVPLLVVGGAALHGWGMYRTHRRNP